MTLYKRNLRFLLFNACIIAVQKLSECLTYGRIKSQGRKCLLLFSEDVSQEKRVAETGITRISVQI